MKSVTAKRVLVPLAVVVVLGAVYALAAFGRTASLGAAKQTPPPQSAPVAKIVRHFLSL